MIGAFKLIKRHKFIFFDNKNPERCRKPSSSISRNNGHNSCRSIRSNSGFIRLSKQ